MEQKENKYPSTHVLEFSGESGIMKGKTTAGVTEVSHFLQLGLWC